MGKIIGIDLGTTNSCVAVMEGNEPVVIANSEGRRTTPSIVGFLDNGKGERKVGDPAKRQAITNPKNTVSSIKRFMGKKFGEVTGEKKMVSYEVESGNNDTVRVRIGDRMYTPQEISAMILQKMKSTAEDYLGTTVTEAIITVPAYFNDAERQATKEAGQIAGLDVKRIINEPTAAALAYGLDKKNKDMKIAVYDLGGGTFDVSILELGDGVFEVKSTNGDVHLGGDDFDMRVMNWLADEFKADKNIDLRKDPMALQRLKEASEKAKIELSSGNETEINLPYITSVDGVPEHLVKKLSRAKFEQLCDDLIKRTLEPCKKAMADSGYSVSQIDEVILVGGSTRIPRIVEEVEKFFGKKLIESNTTIPSKKSEVFSTASDSQPSVEIHVLQGERPMAKDNRTIGRFHLDGIPPAPRGVPQIEVIFDIDANGILHVAAKDKGTGKEQKIRIEASSGLTDAEIQKMKQEAAANAESDKKEKDKVEKINQADSLVFQTEKQLKEFGDKLSEGNKSAINGALIKLKEAHASQDLAAIDTAMNALNTAWTAASQEMYAQGGQPGAEAQPNPGADANAGAGNTTGGADAQDVEYEEVKK